MYENALHNVIKLHFFYSCWQKVIFPRRIWLQQRLFSRTTSWCLLHAGSLLRPAKRETSGVTYHNRYDSRGRNHQTLFLPFNQLFLFLPLSNSLILFLFVSQFTISFHWDFILLLVFFELKSTQNTKVFIKITWLVISTYCIEY